MAGHETTSTRTPQPGPAVATAVSNTPAASPQPGAGASPGAAQPTEPTSLSAMPAASWFTFTFWLAAGAITAYALVRVVSGLGSLLSILMLAVFFATALDPMVTALVHRGLRRSLAVTVVALAVLGVLAGFVAVIFPPVDKEVNSLIDATPGYLEDLRNRSTYLGNLEARYHLVEKAKSWIDANKAGTLDLNGILGAGKAVFSILTGTLTAIALTLYFVANLPGIKHFSYHLVPVRRRPRVAELTDRILAQVGRDVIGQMIIASIGGLCTWVWAMAWGIPYPAALGIVVAVFGLVPVIGSSIGGAVVTLVALTVSLNVSIATLVYYIAARLAEDYLVAPRVNRRTVDVHPMVTILAVLVGGALFGVVGALVAIPAAVAIKLVATEVLLPRIDEM
jgi:predicted PurR-regulated permease PerM